MPRTVVVVRSKVTEGLDSWITNRIPTADGTDLQVSDVTGTVSVRVYDASGAGEGRTPNASIFTKTDIAVAGTILDTLATTYWDGKNSTGYNFIYRLIWDATGATGPYLRGGHTYNVEFEVTASNFGVLRWKHILEVNTGKTV